MYQYLIIGFIIYTIAKGCGNSIESKEINI